MGLTHEKKSYLQEKANLFEIGSTDFFYAGTGSSGPFPFSINYGKWEKADLTDHLREFKIRWRKRRDSNPQHPP